MAYDIESLKTGGNAPGNTKETSDQASVEAGLYRHPESGAEAATRFDPLMGNAQSEAFVRLGFVRVGDVPEGYEKPIRVVGKSESGSSSSDELKGVMARLNALEAENAALKAEKPAEEAAPAKEEISEAPKKQENKKGN